MTSGFHFVANLKPYTRHPGVGRRRFKSYLLSIDYARALGDLAREVIANGAVLRADNGNVDLIRALVTENDAAGKELDVERRALSSTLRRSLRPRAQTRSGNRLWQSHVGSFARLPKLHVRRRIRPSGVGTAPRAFATPRVRNALRPNERKRDDGRVGPV